MIRILDDIIEQTLAAISEFKVKRAMENLWQFYPVQVAIMDIVKEEVSITDDEIKAKLRSKGFNNRISTIHKCLDHLVESKVIACQDGVLYTIHPTLRNPRDGVWCRPRLEGNLIRFVAEMKNS